MHGGYDQHSLCNMCVRVATAGSQRLAVIKEIKCALNPLSSFPNASLAKTFREYFENHKFTPMVTTTNEQPLVQIDFVQFNQNFILRSNDYRSVLPEKRPGKYDILFIAEHVVALPFNAKQVFNLFMLPSVLYRANCLMKARALKTIVERELLSKFNIKQVSCLFFF